MTCLRIQFHAGTRPVGIAVDSLEQSFQTIARLLQACWPAQVHFFLVAIGLLQMTTARQTAKSTFT